MQTNFSAEQLLDPRLAEADQILKRCVHCGLCTATCSTYVLLGDERDSPRGRIYLMKDMFERDRKASPQVQHHVDRCLSCLSCMTTCPGGVDYMHLVDLARVHIEETGRRSLKDRLMRRLLAAVVPYPNRFRKAVALAPLGRPFTKVMRRVGLSELAAMVELAPTGMSRTQTYDGPGTAASTEKRRAKVLMLAGCAQQVLRPDINDATIRMLARRGVDVEVAAGAGCCGALVHHMGKENEAHTFVKANIDAWSKIIEREPVDAIIINASGCGTTVKDYGHMMARVEGYAERAASAPDRHYPASLLLGKVVGQQGGAGRVIAGLADPEHGAAEEELREVSGEACEEGGDAPDGDSDSDHGPPYAAVCPVTEGQGGDGVLEKEGRTEQADQRVAEMEFLLNQGGGRGGDPPIHVVEEVDADHDHEHVSGIAARHRAIMWGGSPERVP